MTSAVAAPSETKPGVRRLRLRQVLSMGVMRFAVVTGATSLASALAVQYGESSLWVSLDALLLTGTVAGLWPALDAWRCQPLMPSALAWALASILLVTFGPLPEFLASPPVVGGWNAIGAYLADVGDGAVLVLALTAVPAVLGLVIGHLFRERRESPARR